MTTLFQYFKKFNPLSKEAEQAIAEISSIIIIKKNKDLQPIGHTCKTIYFIKKGVARIYYFKDGIDITESFFFENSIIARVESLFTGKPSRKAIQILEDAEIIAINSTKLSNCMIPTLKLKDCFVKYLRPLMWKQLIALKAFNFIRRKKGIMLYLTKLLTY